MWEEQYQRTQRYIEKLKKHEGYRVLNGRIPTDFLDDVYTCIQHLHHLKDWLISSGKITKEDANQFIDFNPQLKLIQDLCNGTKHLTTEFREGDIVIGVKFEESYRVRGYSHEKRAKFIINYAGNEYEVSKLAEEALGVWEKYLSERGIEVNH